jgi:hypothetical protein
MSTITLNLKDTVANDFQCFAQTHGLQPEEALEFLLNTGVLLDNDEPIPEEHLDDIMEGWAEATRREGMDLEDFIALRRVERAEAKKQREMGSKTGIAA